MQKIKKAGEFLGREHSWRYDVVLLTLSAVLHVVLWWYLKNHFSFIYSMSDDMLYRDMVSGVLYGKVTHNIIYQHWFSWIVSWLYTTFSTVEWCALSPTINRAIHTAIAKGAIIRKLSLLQEYPNAANSTQTTIEVAYTFLS